jgi:CBS domain containing-hemolysin-like protein
MGPPSSERIDHLQRKKQEIAVVRADGYPRGLVTSTNALDAIAGELEDPGDVGRRDRSRQDPEPVAPSSPGARP